MMVWRAAVCGLALAALTAACTPLPRPFAHGPDRPPSALVHLMSATGVTVLATTPQDEAVAADMAKALRALDTPAEVAARPRPGSYVLARTDGGGWRLAAPDGSELSSLSGSAPVEEIAPALAHAVEADVALPLTARLRRGDSARAGSESTGSAAYLDAPAPALPRVVRVAAVEGLDDGRARLLRGALEEALRRQGITVVAEDAPFAVAGRLDQSPPHDGAVPVRLTWTLMHDNGSEIGTAEQANAVPADILEHGFVMLAPLIAAGGAEGVSALLDAAVQAGTAGPAAP